MSYSGQVNTHVVQIADLLEAASAAKVPVTITLLPGTVPQAVNCEVKSVNREERDPHEYYIEIEKAENCPWTNIALKNISGINIELKVPQ